MKSFFVLVLFLAMLVEQVYAGCPIGSYDWVDEWGNKICKSFDNGQTNSIEGTTRNCPTGTYSWVDEWGNAVCKSHRGNRQYYDTSEGCPVGTHEWIDSWGNRICKGN